MIKDNSQILQLAKLHNQILELSKREFTSVEWESEALVATTNIMPLLPVCATSEFSFLEPIARLVEMSLPQDTFRSIFLHLLLLHLFNLNLYPMIASPSKLEQLLEKFQKIRNDQKDIANDEPRILFSPFDYFFDLKKFSETNLDQTDMLLECLIQILQMLQKLHDEPNPPWNVFGEIVNYMLQSRGHRDLVTLIFFHDEKSVALVHRSSLLSSSGVLQKHSQLIVEMLLLRPSLVATHSMLKALPGATRLIPIYPKQQHAALEIAHNVPFRFILDLLNQSYKIIDFIDTTILACASIASQKVLLLSASKQRLYSEFNSISSARSLLYVMNQFGCVITQNILRRIGKTQIAEALFNLVSPKTQSLPPTSKPNYFFAERKIAYEDETIMMMQTLEEFNELQLIISLLLRSIGRIINEELHQVADLTKSHELSEKILIRNLQHTFTFLLAAKRCCSACDEASNVNIDIDASIIQVTRRIFQSLEGRGSLIWVTLYNLANDLCYAEVSMVPTVLWFLKQTIEKQGNESQAALIDSGIRVFIDTFGDVPAEAGGESEEGFVELSPSEYAFLYQKPAVVSGYSEEKGSKIQNQNSSSGRQQSVHVDRYKK